MEKKFFRKRIFEANPGLVSLPIILLGMLSSSCGGEHDLLTAGFNCENEFHVQHSTCGAASATVSFLSPN